MVLRLPSRFVIAALVTTLALVSHTPADAAARSGTHSRMTTVTFRLHTATRPQAGTTFWVAYGPLASQWGLVRLSARGNGLYEASRTLPADGRTTFAYLAGNGVIHAQFGPAPGNPVVTVRSVGPVIVSRVGRSTVEWYPPAG